MVKIVFRERERVEDITVACDFARVGDPCCKSMVREIQELF